MTRAELDQQYRAALAANPQANRSGGRGGPVDEDQNQLDPAGMILLHRQFHGGPYRPDHCTHCRDDEHLD